MAEAFGIAAGAVGIAAPALHWARLLLADLERISDAPQTVESLKGDIHLIETTLRSLSAFTERELAALGTSVIDRSKITLTTCAKSCEKFRADLLHWTKHSSHGGLSWRDRANVGFFKDNKIKSMSEQLRKYQVSLNLVTGMATLYALFQ